MICPHCNSFVEDGNTFCTNCGNTLTAQANPYGAQQQYSQPDPYGAQQQYSQPDPYGAQQYGQQNPYTPQQPAQQYGQANPYMPNQQQAQQNPYGAQQQYGQQSAQQYGQPNPYMPQQQYGQQNPYMPQGNPYAPVPPVEPMKGVPDRVIGPNGEELGMGWFKFIIYFQLFATAIVSLYNAYAFITGEIYAVFGGSPKMVFSRFPSLKTVGIVCGLLYLVTAVGAIYTRFRLAGFKKNGPMMYFAVIGVIILATAIYMFGVISAVSKVGIPASKVVNSNSYGVLAGYIALIVVNIIYFNKRRKLFVN